ncbi:MAG: hypothetical protein IPI67_01065 [Myxococcales bacterium]|nr:hypothetical protein [Myxococcales bacterium]
MFRAEDPALSFSLTRDKDGRPIARCDAECVVPLVTGKYFLQIEDSARFVRGRRRFEVSEPSEIGIEPRTHAQQSGGVVMGSVGIGLLVAGIAGMLAGGIPLGHGSEDRDGAKQSLFLLGLLGFAGGAVLTPIGWVRAGRSGPALTVTPLGPR